MLALPVSKRFSRQEQKPSDSSGHPFRQRKKDFQTSKFNELTWPSVLPKALAAAENRNRDRVMLT